MFKRGTRSRLWHVPQECRVMVFIMCLVLVVAVYVLAFGFRVQKLNSFDSLGQFKHKREFRNGTDLIWQIPDSPKAVLFLAHGCNGRALNFWDRSPDCPKCVGLPEERLLVLHALFWKFAVLTISSAKRCWTFGEEKLIVEEIIRWWIKRHKLEKLPLVALGASSGGYFVSALAYDLRFSSITLMIAEGVFDKMDIPNDYPPTLFVHMPKDVYRQQKISEFIEVLRNKGIDVAEIECMDFPLSPTFLADRIPGLDPIVSAKLFDLFRNKGFIDENGYMKRDGRSTRWKEALQGSKAVLLDKNLVQHVQEELNLAFAYHEMTSLQSEQIFKWFESHMV
ncbi:hypothetical protein SLE2022_212040 [Rubroshorea leprosula]